MNEELKKIVDNKKYWQSKKARTTVFGVISAGVCFCIGVIAVQYNPDAQEVIGNITEKVLISITGIVVTMVGGQAAVDCVSTYAKIKETFKLK